MADQNNRYPDNAPGPFFVDTQCLDCDVCRMTAPANFARNDDGGYSYVKKQPETQDELERCFEALNFCHTEAIGCHAVPPDWDRFPAAFGFLWAVQSGDLARFEYWWPEMLLQASDWKSYRTNDIVNAAIRSGQTAIAERFFQHPDAFPISRQTLIAALDEAISRNDLEMVDLLFRYGAKPSGVPVSGGNSLERANETRNQKMIDRVLAAGGISRRQALQQLEHETDECHTDQPPKKTCRKCDG